MNKIKLCRFVWKNATEEEKLNRMRLLIEQYIEKNEYGCWDWSGDINKCGYAHIKIGGRTESKSYNAHRIAYLVYKGKIQDGLVVCHTCDNRLCCNPEHLFLGTHLDNMRDMISKKRERFLKGADCPWAKLREYHILTILDFIRYGMNCGEIARLFNITRGQIQEIKSGRKWGHIGDRSDIEMNPRNIQKITPELAKQIKQWFAEGRKVSHIAQELNINRTTIDDIKKGKTWKNI